MSQRRNNIRELASRIVALQAKARALGLFTNDRELLECQKCGLLEDVTFSELLITCRAPDFGQDTDLRFEELSQDRFRCPVCGSIVHSDWGKKRSGASHCRFRISEGVDDLAAIF